MTDRLSRLPDELLLVVLKHMALPQSTADTPDTVPEAMRRAVEAVTDVERVRNASRKLLRVGGDYYVWRALWHAIPPPLRAPVQSVEEQPDKHLAWQVAVRLSIEHWPEIEAEWAKYEKQWQKIEEARVGGTRRLDLNRRGYRFVWPQIGGGTSGGNFTQLEWLYLDGNRLTSLPESIAGGTSGGNLTSLERLYLTDNQLTSLPESIGNLTSLEGLYLVNNQLTRLPSTIAGGTSGGNLTSLKDIYLANNPLTSLRSGLIATKLR